MTTAVPISVSARAASALTVVEMRAALARELGVLFEDLALPLQPNIEIETGPDLGKEQLDILVDGVPCANRPPRHAADEMSAQRRMAELLHANVETLVTGALVQSLWRDWRGDDAPCPPGFGALLRRLVRFRLRVDRVAPFVVDWDDAEAAQRFEQALSTASRRIVIELHPQTRQQMEPELTGAESLFSMMIDGLFYELGIRIGECVLIDSADSGRTAMRLRINDLRTPEQPLIAAAEILVNETPDRLRLLDIDGREAVNPANGSACALVANALKDACEKAGLTTWSPAGHAVLGTSALLRRVAPVFLSLDAVMFDLNRLSAAYPTLTDGVRASLGPVRFAQVLRALLEDDISVRNLPAICEAILSAPPRTAVDVDKYIVFTSTYGALRLELPLVDIDADADAIEIAECVRINQKRYISHKYTRGQNTLIVYLVDREIEARLKDVRPLDAAEQEALHDAVRAEVGSLPPTAQAPVLLTTLSVRHRLRRMLRPAFPELAVLSYQELSPDMNIQPIARISY